MFPNFESLAQREQKRQELLEKTQRRVRQANAKRQMYEGASWASDVSDSIILAKKATTSTQTDSSTEAAESFKKTLSDEYSQTNPEVSTPNVLPVMIDAEVDAEPRMTDGWVHVRPNTTDSNVEARPQTSDSGVNVSPQTADIGSDATPQTAEAETNTKIRLVDTEDQVAARSWIKNLFNANPNWAALRVKPIKRKTGKDDNRYYLGSKGSLIVIKTGRKSKTYQSIDWIATEQKLRDIWYEGESKSIDEVSDMRLEDPLYHASLMKEHLEKGRLEKQRFERKRKGEELEDLDVALKDRRLPVITFDRKATSTASDDESSKLRLFWILSKNREMLESNGLNKSIEPVFKGTLKSNEIGQDEYVWIDNGSIGVYGKESNLIHKASIKKISWSSTLNHFLEMVKSRGLELTMVGRVDKELSAKPYEGIDDEDVEPRHGAKSGLDEGMNEKLSTHGNDAKLILEQYYRRLFEKKVSIPFPLKPIIDSKNGVEPHPTYYFSEPMRNRPLNIRNQAQKIVSGNVWDDLMETIRWMETFLSLLSGLEDVSRTASDIEAPATEKELKMIKTVSDNLKIIREVIFSNATDVKQPSVDPYHDDALQKLHDESEAAFMKYGEAQKRYEESKQAVKSSNSKAARSALKAATSAMKATKAVYQAKAKTYSDAQKATISDGETFADKQNDRRVRGVMNDMLHTVSGSGPKGRGLMGAGVAPLEGVVRRSRTYNLNEIQGLATPSAYVYRQLGSKYIRIPDLNNKTLVIVQPNRRKCGPKRVISDQLQSVIRTLAYKQHIDQPSYDKLSIDDKKLFKEILAITHLQYNFHDKLEDPLDSLKAEYDKLKGELELGNDNPSIIKQLKSLSVDMYSNRLISDSEFKDIIVRLI